MEIAKKRNLTIDAMKGAAIILVVLGHVICDVYDPITYNNNLIFKFCYSFHMPLFTFLSANIWGGGNNK